MSGFQRQPFVVSATSRAWYGGPRLRAFTCASVTVVPYESQLFHPIGGVGARSPRWACAFAASATSAPRTTPRTSLRKTTRTEEGLKRDKPLLLLSFFSPSSVLARVLL